MLPQLLQSAFSNALSSENSSAVMSQRALARLMLGPIRSNKGTVLSAGRKQRANYAMRCCGVVDCAGTTIMTHPRTLKMFFFFFLFLLNRDGFNWMSPVPPQTSSIMKLKGGGEKM